MYEWGLQDWSPIPIKGIKALSPNACIGAAVIQDGHNRGLLSLFRGQQGGFNKNVEDIVLAPSTLPNGTGADHSGRSFWLLLVGSFLISALMLQARTNKVPCMGTFDAHIQLVRSLDNFDIKIGT